MRVDENGTLRVLTIVSWVSVYNYYLFVSYGKANALSFLVMIFECSQCRIKLAMHLVILKWS